MIFLEHFSLIGEHFIKCSKLVEMRNALVDGSMLEPFNEDNL